MQGLNTGGVEECVDTAKLLRLYPGSNFAHILIRALRAGMDGEPRPGNPFPASEYSDRHAVLIDAMYEEGRAVAGASEFDTRH